MHDAHEALTHDLSQPVKQTINHLFPHSYETFEYRIARRIRHLFGLPEAFPKEVHDADQTAFRIEIGMIMSRDARAAYMGMGIEPIMAKIGAPSHMFWYMPQKDAYELFLERFTQLSAGNR